MKKSTLKKLIKDSSQKLFFHLRLKFIKKLMVCQQVRRFKRLIVDKLVKDGLIKFYIRYVDDTLVLPKVEDIDNIIKQFNSFDKSNQFTIDRFEDGIAHFLDIKIYGSETDLYYKATHTRRQYCDFSSQAPWKLKIFWINTLHDRATKTFFQQTSY